MAGMAGCEGETALGVSQPPLPSSNRSIEGFFLDKTKYILIAEGRLIKWLAG